MGNLHRDTITIFHYKITEAQRKVAVLLMVVDPKAHGLLQNLFAPMKPANKDFEEIV